jgi:hypothetical protein
MNTTTSHRRLAVLAITLLAAAGCGSSSSTTDGASALDATIASATDAAGTLLCSPSQAQVDACAGLVAGDPCTLANVILPGGETTVAGACRATLDGTTVACAPVPRGPPAELVEACTDKAAGDACEVTAPDGESHTGVCATARDGTTLVCGRQHVPPQAAIDACSTLAAGDACTMPAHDGTGTVTGVCSLGPASTGPLACAPAQHLRPNATEACAGLEAGAACTVGHHGELSGSCVVPAAGGDAVCLPACADVGGRFRCGPGGHEGSTGGGMGGGMGGHHGGHH